jgi:hypothetical protein
MTQKKTYKTEKEITIRDEHSKHHREGFVTSLMAARKLEDPAEGKTVAGDYRLALLRVPFP